MATEGGPKLVYKHDDPLLGNHRNYSYSQSITNDVTVVSYAAVIWVVS